MYKCNDEVMSVLPLAQVLEMPSCDNWGGNVHSVMEWKKSDPWFPAVVESIRRHGFTKGIRVDPTTGWVMDGHHRIAAAMELGLSYIPVEEGYSEYDTEFFKSVKSGEYGKEATYDNYL